MKVIPPLTITDAMLTTPAVAEPDASVGEVDWSNATAYAVGAKVVRTTTHRVYECVQAHTNHDPAADTANAYWIDAGPTNRWAMFDLLRNTGTVGPSPLTAAVTPGVRVGAIGVVGIVADSVTVTMTVLGSPVYTNTLDLRVRDTVTWYDYFFGEFEQRTAIALFDLPPYTNGVITVTLERDTGDCTCGGVVLGTAVDLGTTIHGAENDALNFSKIERDEFGTAILQQKRTVPKANITTRIRKEAVNKALRARVDLNAQPALWSGLDDATSGYFEPLLILGVYKRFTIDMDQPNSAQLSLEIEEV